MEFANSLDPEEVAHNESFEMDISFCSLVFEVSV